MKSERLVGSEKDDKWRETIINEAPSALEYVHINMKSRCRCLIKVSPVN